jgi:DNA-binding transcriptional ArsR family regulator
MKHKNFITKDTFIIQDLETLKVLADQIRLQIYETLLLNPQTIREVAAKLGFLPKRLYYHFGLLEEHGVIRVSSTSLVRNLQEKQYAVSASNLAVDPDLLDTGGQNEDTRAWLSSRLDVTREDILRSLQANPIDIYSAQSPVYGNLLLSRALVQIGKDRAEEFRQRLKDLIADFDQLDQEGTGVRDNLDTYALTVVFYPIHHFPSEKK